MAKKHEHTHLRNPRTEKELFQRILDDGGTIEKRRRNHYVAIAPNGGRVTIGSTISDHRAVANVWSYWRNELKKNP